MIEIRSITKRDMKNILSMGYKKTANYGIAVNQVLYPLGNDNTNVKYIYDKYKRRLESINYLDYRILWVIRCFFHKKQKAETNSSFLPIGDTPVQNFMKSRIYGSAGNQLLYPLGNENSNIKYIYDKYNYWLNSKKYKEA